MIALLLFIYTHNVLIINLIKKRYFKYYRSEFLTIHYNNLLLYYYYLWLLLLFNIIILIYYYYFIILQLPIAIFYSIIILDCV